MFAKKYARLVVAASILAGAYAAAQTGSAASVQPSQSSADSASTASQPLAANPPVGNMATVAPTITTMSQLQRAELEREARRRLEKLNPPPPAPPPAPAASSPAAVAAATAARAPRVEPDTTKEVVAIYGFQGKETAEIRMPDGTVMKAAAGMQSPGFKVLRVERDAVLVEAQVKKATTGKTEAGKAVRGKKKGAKPEDEAGNLFTVLRLPVGGKFR